MRTLALLLTSSLLLAACGSSGHKLGDMPADMAPPSFEVQQVPGQFVPNRNNPNPVQVAIDVKIQNNANEAMTLERLQIQSMGGGAYQFASTSKIWNTTLAPHETKTFEMYVEAEPEDVMTDEQTPISVRGTAIFKTSRGQFRRVFIQPLFR